MEKKTSVLQINLTKELNFSYNFFNKHSFKIEVIDSKNLSAKKNGNNFYFLKYIDFYFVKYVDSVSTDSIEDFHIQSIFTANKSFKMPKFLRLSIPNINSVIITNSSLSEEVVNYVSRKRINTLGGQQETVFIISISDQKIFCPGKEITKPKGEAKLFLGSQKEFKTLNGNNRAFYLMEKFSKKLFSKINSSILKTIK